MSHPGIRNIFKSEEPVSKKTVAWAVIIGPILFMIVVLIGFIISDHISKNRDALAAKQQRMALCTATNHILRLEIQTYQNVIATTENTAIADVLRESVKELQRVHRAILSGCENVLPISDVP